MCGIAGFFGSGAFPAENLRRDLAHRGPDGQGYWTSQTDSERAVHLVHTRLSILDLSPAGAQPMRDPVSGGVIAFNGEIFNYRTLRAGLGGEAAFRSSGDTEVLLRGLADRGPAFFAELDGMFAVLWHDPAQRRLVIARDPMGIKPLYYARTTNGGWLFASEVRAIVRSGLWQGGVNQQAVGEYLRLGNIPEPETIFTGIRAFPAGHWGEIRFEKPESLRTESFWPIERIMAEPPPRDAAAWHAEVWRETMHEHLESDVSTGVFLSAGLDSTAILEAMTPEARSRVTAFTLAGEPTSTDEGALAALTAANLGVSHHIVRPSPHEAITWVREGLGAMDQPTSDGVNTYVISRASRSANFTVALGGAGADELHGAYGYAQSLPKLASLMRAAGPLSGLLRRGGVFACQRMRGTIPAERLNLLLAEAPVLWRMTQERRRYFTPTQIRALWPEGAHLTAPWQAPTDLPEDYDRLDPFNAVTLAELKGYLRNMLLRDADWATMANQQELRVPFLGRKYVECALRLPPSLRRPSALSAKPLIAAGLSPANRELIKRPKTGFNLAYGQMLLGPFRENLHSAAQTLREQVGINLDAEDTLKRLAQTQSAADAFRVWSLLALGTYLQRHAPGATIATRA